MTRYSTSQELLEKVRTGKGDPDIYTSFEHLYVENFFGGTLSRSRVETIKQDSYTGENDIRQAKAAMYSYLIDMERNPDYSEAVYFEWESELQQAAVQFNEDSVYIRVELLTEKGVVDAYKNDIQRDRALVPVAVAVVSFYIVCMLGSCSPLHCRVVAGLGGILCIGLAYAAGFSVMFALGG